jgi:hypothetical protein
MEILSRNFFAGTGEKYENLIQDSQILIVDLNRVSLERQSKSLYLEQIFSSSYCQGNFDWYFYSPDILVIYITLEYLK